MKTLLITTAIAGLLTFANVAHASPSSDKGGDPKHSQMTDVEKAEHMQKRLDRMATKLGLTNEQKTQIQALKQNSRNEIKPLYNEQQTLRKEIRELDTSTNDYAEKLADVANRQAEITRQIIIAKGNQHQRMSAILTPEQLAKKKEMQKNRKGKFHKRKHKKQKES